MGNKHCLTIKKNTFVDVWGSSRKIINSLDVCILRERMETILIGDGIVFCTLILSIFCVILMF